VLRPRTETSCPMMVKKGVRGRVPTLVHYTHGTYYSTSVAIGRLADVAALGGKGALTRESKKAHIVPSLACKSATRLLSWQGTLLIRRKTVDSPSSKRGGDSVRPWVVDRPEAAAGEDRRAFATAHRRPSEEKSSHADGQIRGVCKPSLRGFGMLGV
jgi:hypothetical protein